LKILVSDKLSDEGVKILSGGGFTVDAKAGLSPEEPRAIIGDYDALVVRSATKATSEIIEADNMLQVIGRAGAGVDNIDAAAASRQDIMVMNTPGGNTVITGGHAISMMMALTRNIIINVDTEVPKKVIEKIRKVPNALSVQQVFI
jgi:D-3-phosphoglycerate dehydrogenase